MTDEALMMISTDGHVSPYMAEYRPYLDPEFREEFEDFLLEYDEKGSRNSDLRDLEGRLDPETLEEWDEKMLASGRWQRFHDREQRLDEVEREGVVAEVLFPDFGGIPFQLSGIRGSLARKEATVDLRLERAGMRAYNRWLVDFVSTTPERYAGMALVGLERGSDDMVDEIRRAHAAGLKGIILPKFSLDRPLYHPDFEPVWQVLEELEMVANSHAAASSTWDRIAQTPGAPHPACAVRIQFAEYFFFLHNILSHLIWGGVLERHPRLKVVLTEMGSGWVLGDLANMDYTYDGSYFRHDYHDVIRSKPSEYFQRQCYLGSSVLARSEIAARHRIGLPNMMVGMDMPHHEGMLIESTQEYLKATLGAEQVPVDEARMLLGGNAAAVFGFELEKLTLIAERVGPSPEDVLTLPERDLYARGDVHRPMTTAL